MPELQNQSELWNRMTELCQRFSRINDLARELDLPAAQLRRMVRRWRQSYNLNNQRQARHEIYVREARLRHLKQRPDPTPSSQDEGRRTEREIEELRAILKIGWPEGKHDGRSLRFWPDAD